MSDPASLADLFPEPLQPDPAVALSSSFIRFPKVVAGPVHGAQFVIEIAGPHSVAAQQARELLGPKWYSALGNPEVFCMAPADQAWRLMSTTDGAGSYDSIALAWDLFSAKGELSSASATHLLQAASSFAQAVQRRAFPFPDPPVVDRLVSGFEQARENLDVGVELVVQGPMPFDERDIWAGCAALGLDLSTEGAFIWKVPEWEDALLAVASIDEGALFSLRGVKGSATHEALTVGFNVPRSPDPIGCLKSAFQTAKVLAQRFGAQALDENGRALTPKLEAELEGNLKVAVESLKGSGIVPGSGIARKIFS